MLGHNQAMTSLQSNGVVEMWVLSVALSASLLENPKFYVFRMKISNQSILQTSSSNYIDKFDLV